MPFLRVLPSAVRPSSTLPRTAIPGLSQHRFYAHSGYGDGDGNPVSENPQDQGASPSADHEHPGPPPVSEGQGSGSTPTKATSGGHNSSSSTSSSSAGSSSSGAASGRGKVPQPKIHDERGGPKASSHDDDAAAVKQHNKEFDSRHERGSGVERGKADEVGKGFWQGEIQSLVEVRRKPVTDRDRLGQGGVDRDP